ncbi:MAG: putative salt-induced outer membrane protein YdiY [Alphaproteobacteria bacterium]|jgi:putative salt-induced outer membrane protein YdiY
MKKQLAAITVLTLCCAAPVFAEEVKELEMNGEFGFIFTTGNTETTSASAGLSAKQELEKWSNEFLLSGLYKKDTVENAMGEEVEQTSAQKFFASGQGNYKLENPNHRVFGFASYEDDKFSNFKYQATIAAGWNQKLWDDESSSFDYSVGPGHSFSENQLGESLNSAIVRGAVNYSLNVSETARFTQTFSTEIGSDNTKSRAESALTAQIAGGLSMKLSLKFDHNSDVVVGVDKLDTETAVTLVYTFF